MPIVKVVKIHPKAVIPCYMTEGAAGCDVMACLDKPIDLPVGAREAVPTGLKMEIPVGFEIQVRPRSGLALKKGVTVVNAPGTIDSDYRGELKVLLVNLGQVPACIEPGERIAQLVLAKVERSEWQEATELSDTARGEGGFGSTGRS